MNGLAKLFHGRIDFLVCASVGIAVSVVVVSLAAVSEENWYQQYCIKYINTKNQAEIPCVVGCGGASVVDLPLCVWPEWKAFKPHQCIASKTSISI